MGHVVLDVNRRAQMWPMGQWVRGRTAWGEMLQLCTMRSHENTIEVFYTEERSCCSGNNHVTWQCLTCSIPILLVFCQFLTMWLC